MARRYNDGLSIERTRATGHDSPIYYVDALWRCYAATKQNPLYLHVLGNKLWFIYLLFIYFIYEIFG